MSSVRPGSLFTTLAGVCLLAALAAQGPLTSLMSLHMLVQVPLLMLAGLFAERAASHGRGLNRKALTTQGAGWHYNEYGVPGLVLASLMGAAWMIPKVLDDALTDWRVAVFKYVGLPACGWILGDSLRRAPAVIKLFFLGNFCWMAAIVGMLYLDQPVRLCNAYLLDDQDWAGRGLIALAILLPLGWLLAEIRPIWRFVSR